MQSLFPGSSLLFTAVHKCLMLFLRSFHQKHRKKPHSVSVPNLLCHSVSVPDFLCRSVTLQEQDKKHYLVCKYEVIQKIRTYYARNRYRRCWPRLALWCWKTIRSSTRATSPGRRCTRRTSTWPWRSPSTEASSPRPSRQNTTKFHKPVKCETQQQKPSDTTLLSMKCSFTFICVLKSGDHFPGATCFARLHGSLMCDEAIPKK